MVNNSAKFRTVLHISIYCTARQHSWAHGKRSNLKACHATVHSLVPEKIM